ncbi:transposase [Streptomyces sp. NPDC060022]|uniref:transposase n=1 Tax=Streptomyces sp. NPDC060022 TaxID=3347039 RepID=UPI00368F1DDA
MTAAASTELSPCAIAFQNLTRSSRQATLGRPGEGICPRYSRTARCRFPTLITNPQLTKVLRRPIESAQYTSQQFACLAAQFGVRLSVGRTGQYWDNALAESFFSTIKRELLGTSAWPSRAAARTAIFDFIEGWYNLHRLHSSLGYLSPAEYETALAA